MIHTVSNDTQDAEIPKPSVDPVSPGWRRWGSVFPTVPPTARRRKRSFGWSNVPLRPALGRLWQQFVKVQGWNMDCLKFTLVRFATPAYVLSLFCLICLWHLSFHVVSMALVEMFKLPLFVHGAIAKPEGWVLHGHGEWDLTAEIPAHDFLRCCRPSMAAWGGLPMLCCSTDLCLSLVCV